MQKLVAGQPVMLQREPRNTYDPMAVSVSTLCGQALGYVPRDRNTAFQVVACGVGWTCVDDRNTVFQAVACGVG